MTFCAACVESDVAGGEPTTPQGAIPLRLNVGNLVELQTRGTDVGLQNGSLAQGASVGVFVMYERDYDSLRIGSSYHNTSYAYDNVRCRLEADGSLCPTDLTEMFYPMGQDMKVAVFAYAPYDPAMTREALLLPKDSIHVDLDQSEDSVILRNDILLGTPVVGNPLRTPITDHSSAPYPSESISLNLSHQRCRIVLDLKFSGTEQLMQGQPVFHADSILVYAEDVPTAAPLGYAMDSAMVNYAPADSLIFDTLLMATYTDVYVGEGEELPFVATALVLPSSAETQPSFCVVMISDGERRYIRRRATQPVALNQGTSVSFRTTVDSRGLDFTE